MRLLYAALLLVTPALAESQDRPAPRPAPPAAEAPATRPDTPEVGKKAAAEPEVGETETDPTPAPDTVDTATGDDSAADTPEVSPPVAASDFDHAACLLSLYSLGAQYHEVPPITEPDQPGCGIMRPVQITEILPGVTLGGQPVMHCDTARQLAFWMRDSVQPAARFLPDAPRVTGVQPGSTYQCRDTVGNSSTQLSEHALGNAFDVMALDFDNESTLVIEPRQDTGDMSEAFQRAIRGAACLYFTTVLGPGANAAHDDHLHLDIKARKGGWRLCQ